MLGGESLEVAITTPSQLLVVGGMHGHGLVQQLFLLLYGLPSLQLLLHLPAEVASRVQHRVGFRQFSVFDAK